MHNQQKLSSNCLSTHACGQIQPKSNMSHKDFWPRDYLEEIWRKKETAIKGN